MARILLLWNKLRKAIDGNKTLLGVVLIYVDSYLFPETKSGAHDALLYGIWTWTGYGAADKFRKSKPGQETINKVSNIRESVNLFRNRR